MPSSDPSRRTSPPAWRIGLWLGAGAGLFAALGDYGAQWLWVPSWTDRWELLLRLLASLPTAGALLGALLGLFHSLTAPWVARFATRIAPPEAVHLWRRRLAPLPFVLVALLPSFAVAWPTFQGARASRLPGGPWAWSLASTAALALGLYLALRLLPRILEHGRTRPHRLPAAALLATLAQFLLSKADQLLFPKLYEPLHASLATAAALATATALACLGSWRPAWVRATAGSRPRSALLTILLLGVGTLHLLTLERNANVQVALFDPRAGSSRSLMLGLRQLLPAHDGEVDRAAIARARAARHRRRRVDERGLPSTAGAHLLLVTVDALRADHLGLYGYRKHPTSPFLDELARESVVFDHAYAQAPHSSYSLCSLMTSEYLHETVELGLPLPTATLASVLGEAGYHTAAFYTRGIFHTEGEKLRRYDSESFGFRRYDHSETDAERKTDAVLEEIDRLVERGEPPGFFWVHYFDVHEPYRDERFGHRDEERYDGEIARVDTALRRLWREARRRLSRPVVLLVTADHGEEFRDHGGLYHGSSLYEEQVHVPLLLRVPGLASRRIAAPVQLVDVAPTLLGLLDVPPPGSMRGADLRALIDGRIERGGPAFSAVMRKRMVVDGGFKLIAELRYGLYELYDLRADPAERTNLASSRRATLRRLLGELYAWLDELQRPPDAAPPSPEEADPIRLAMQRARLGDARSVDPLANLVADERADASVRAEAARLLGRMNAKSAADRLARALNATSPSLRAEAAIALGRVRDPRGAEELRRVVHAEDALLRARAGIALGRLGDREAVAALLDAVRLGPSRHDRFEAVRRLGELGGPDVIQPLVELLDEFRLRRDAVIALGRLGDRRAAGPLMDLLHREYRPSIRDAVVEALARMGADETLPDLLHLARDDADLLTPGEAVIRLGALQRHLAGGVDLKVGANAAHKGLKRCHGPGRDTRHFVGSSFCESRGAVVRLRIVPPPPSPGGYVLLLRGRAIGQSTGRIHLQLGAHDPPLEATLGSAWSTVRLHVAGASDTHWLRIEVEPQSVRLALDYVLLIPSARSLASRPPSPNGSRHR